MLLIVLFPWTDSSDGHPLNLEATFLESRARTPLVCLLSLGSDPTTMIEALAKKLKTECKSVSMGQGQEIQAQKLISSAVTGGGWVLLQNTHLGLKFLSVVEQQMLKLEEIDPGFRIWITSEPHPKFPIGLLQMSIKITNEAPVGLKAGLKRSFQWVTQDTLDTIGVFVAKEWRTLLYTVCFLHSIVQERRKFGPIGWCIPYEFSQGDLSASVQFLQNHLAEMETKKSREVTWSTVRYMVAEIQYGGRITDDWDRTLMLTYAERFFRAAVFEDKFQFHQGYSIPGKDRNGAICEISVFRNAVELLPMTDNPEVFGLHQNADLTVRLHQSNVVLRTMLETQPKSSGSGGGVTREESVSRTAEEFLVRIMLLS